MKYIKHIIVITGIYLCLSSCSETPMPHERDYRINTVRADVDSLRQVLTTIFEEDQRVRKALKAVELRYGRRSKEAARATQVMMDTDKENLEKVENFIQCHGFPSKRKFGYHGAKAAFFVLQHAPFEKQLLYYDIIKRAADTGNIKLSMFALFEDRVWMRKGYPQIYGTQVTCATRKGHSECRLYPLEYPDKVDSLRTLVGLPPLGEYLSDMGVKDERYN